MLRRTAIRLSVIVSQRMAIRLSLIVLTANGKPPVRA